MQEREDKFAKIEKRRKERNERMEKEDKKEKEKLLTNWNLYCQRKLFMRKGGLLTFGRIF